MTIRSSRSPALATLLLLAVTTACGGSDAEGAPSEAPGSERTAGPDRSADSPAPPNTLTPAEREAGWRLLFDGETLEGWRGYGMETIPEGWAVVDGTLARVSEAADIITIEQFSDFELSIDWKLDPGGNSGVFYRAAEGEDWIYQSAPEMQLLDDARHPDGESPLTSAGSAFGLYPAPRGAVRPAGEWNESRVVIEGNHVRHWLNGTLVVDYELHSPDWVERVRNSKFNNWPAYGQAERGHIGLQEHGGSIWFRNIKIREIG
ncbi:MAG: DUF1080 domain-containing protein [Longimicrobiales bacterium]|nr:DUF1080 domain-containing protein [Longimicrobiales bacterium]